MPTGPDDVRFRGAGNEWRAVKVTRLTRLRRQRSAHALHNACMKVLSTAKVDGAVRGVGRKLIKRRDFIATLGLVAVPLWARGARAQSGAAGGTAPQRRDSSR